MKKNMQMWSFLIIIKGKGTIWKVGWFVLILFIFVRPLEVWYPKYSYKHPSPKQRLLRHIFKSKKGGTNVILSKHFFSSFHVNYLIEFSQNLKDIIFYIVRLRQFRLQRVRNLIRSHTGDWRTSIQTSRSKSKPWTLGLYQSPFQPSQSTKLIVNPKANQGTETSGRIYF